MRLILQRVSSAEVRVGVDVVGAIERGILVLCGIEKGDGEAQVEAAARKLVGLRIFADDAGRMNLNVAEAGGALLVVSQFTLAASIHKGRRPSFDHAAPGAEAEPLVDALIERLRAAGLRVETGHFGAEMAVGLVNDGPVTFVLDV